MIPYWLCRLLVLNLYSRTLYKYNHCESNRHHWQSISIYLRILSNQWIDGASMEVSSMSCNYRWVYGDFCLHMHYIILPEDDMSEEEMIRSTGPLVVRPCMFSTRLALATLASASMSPSWTMIPFWVTRWFAVTCTSPIVDIDSVFRLVTAMLLKDEFFTAKKEDTIESPRESTSM